MDKRLRVKAGPDKGLAFELPPAGIHNIGKTRQHNEICLHDMKLSRVHCQVEVDEDRTVITDLDSESGTYVNGERVTQHQLHHGDVVKVGDTELTFESIENSSSAAAEPTRVDAASSAPAPAEKHAAKAKGPAQAPPLSLADLKKLSGTSLGPYELGPVVGQGHCALVFRTRVVKDDRLAALKVFHPDFPKDSEEADRFLQTMKLRIPLRHTNLVTVYGVGRTAPYTWMALEFVDGDSVAQRIQKFGASGVPDWPEAFRLAVHVARALHYASHHKMLHRNVTPANILLRGADCTFKLGDLGLTKALAGAHVRHAALKNKIQTEMPFFSPEQTQQSPTLDVRSDIYSLGAVVYVMLMGKPPFAAKTPAEMVAQIRTAEPAKPKQLQPSIPEPFEAAVLKMLAKRPEDRFQTPAELLGALARVEADPV
jgi:serine/threonine protein kinase